MKKILFIMLFLSTIFLFAQTITPIANIQDSVSVYEGEEVTIQGIIFVGVGTTHGSRVNVFLQDDSNRGIMLFDYDITQDYENDLIRGNELQVTGTVDEYNGITEISDFYYEVLSTDNPDPYPVILNLGASNINDYEGSFIQVVGQIIDRWDAGGGTNLEIEDILGNTSIVRVWDSTGIDDSMYDVGFVLEARGAGSVYSNDFQVLPAYDDNLTEGTMSNYPYGQIANGEDILPGVPLSITFMHPASEVNITFEHVLLYWKTNSDVMFNQIEMNEITVRENDFEAEFPSQSQGTTVYFYIVALDSLSTQYIYPTDFLQEQYSFSIPVSSHKAILNVPPKPFNPYAGEIFPIEFASKNGNKAILRIYNSEGKLVYTPQSILIGGNGIEHYDWNGRDREHKLLPLGLYICYLEIIEIDTGKKITAKAPIVIGAPLK